MFEVIEQKLSFMCEQAPPEIASGDNNDPYISLFIQYFLPSFLEDIISSEDQPIDHLLKEAEADVVKCITRLGQYYIIFSWEELLCE